MQTREDKLAHTHAVAAGRYISRPLTPRAGRIESIELDSHRPIRCATGDPLLPWPIYAPQAPQSQLDVRAPPPAIATARHNGHRKAIRSDRPRHLLGASPPRIHLDPGLSPAIRRKKRTLFSHLTLGTVLGPLPRRHYLLRGRAGRGLGGG